MLAAASIPDAAKLIKVMELLVNQRHRAPNIVYFIQKRIQLHGSDGGASPANGPYVGATSRLPPPTLGTEEVYRASPDPARREDCL